MFLRERLSGRNSAAAAGSSAKTTLAAAAEKAAVAKPVYRGWKAVPTGRKG